MAEGRKLTLSIPVLVAILAIIGGAGIWGYLTFGPRQAVAPPPVLTAEARDYLGSLKLSDVNMQAAESYVKQSLVEILGKISNQGQRRVMLVEVNCVFRDTAGQIIKRERVTVAGRKTGPLAPGDTKAFRLAFDDVPGNWNQPQPRMNDRFIGREIPLPACTAKTRHYAIKQAFVTAGQIYRDGHIFAQNIRNFYIIFFTH